MNTRFQLNQKVVIAVVYVSSMILNSLDTTIVNVSLATLATEFGVEPSQVQAVVIGYLVSIAAFMPASGWLGDRFGHRRIFLIALGIFTFASLMCGLSQTLNQLTMWRIVQGAGGGMLMPVGMTMLYRAYPPAERIGISRILMFAMVLGPALGPLLGGAILRVAEWQWTFLVKVPIAAAALAFGWLFLADDRDAEPEGRFDIPGFLLGGIGLGALMYAILEGPNRGWGEPIILTSALVGIGSLIAFVWLELRLTFPLVDLRLLSNRLFLAINKVAFFASAGFLGTLFLVPLWLQEVRGASPLMAGFTTMPEAIGVVISSQIVARAYPYIGPRRLMIGGLWVVTAVIAILGFLPDTVPLLFIQSLMFVMGAGMACIFMPNQAASMATIERHRLGGASMVFSVQRQIASALGVAVVGTVLAIVGVTIASGTGSASPNADAYHTAFRVAALLTFIGSLFAFQVPDEDAAETMIRPDKAPSTAV